MHALRVAYAWQLTRTPEFRGNAQAALECASRFVLMESRGNMRASLSAIAILGSSGYSLLAASQCTRALFGVLACHSSVTAIPCTQNTRAHTTAIKAAAVITSPQPHAAKQWSRSRTHKRQTRSWLCGPGVARRVTPASLSGLRL